MLFYQAACTGFYHLTQTRTVVMMGGGVGGWGDGWGRVGVEKNDEVDCAILTGLVLSPVVGWGHTDGCTGQQNAGTTP